MFPNQPGQQPPYQPPQQPQPYQPPTPEPFPQQQMPQQNTGFPQPQQSPLDYLNQIAPQQAPKKPVFTGLRGIIIIGVILIVIVSILGLVLNIINSGNTLPAQQLGARLTSLQTIADAAQTNLKSSALRSTNSNLRIFLTNTNRDIATPLLAAEVDLEKLDKNVTAAETTRSEATTARLDDARLNAIYDRTYAREMAFELAALLSLMQQVYNGTSDPALRKYLDEVYKNLEPTQKSFADYNEGV
jgi:hypothetical protein